MACHDSAHVDQDELATIMTIHKATFDRLAAHPDLIDQLPDFFANLATTYAAISRQLRRGLDR
jgi:hypothetical protein